MRWLGTALLCASTIALTTAAQAQTTTDPADKTTGADSASAAAKAQAATNGQDIVVTGIRASLANALQQKKLAPNIEEVLTSEGIGKLPDNSIAESLARLPGLSTNRDRGNATSVSIRGMGPELVNTLLNGRELVSAGPDRNIRYDSYPAELITGASVYKSPTASQVEGAIAGQIDLKTIRPLDYKKTQVVLNLRGEYDDLGKKIADDPHSTGWIGSASYIGQFADDTLGVAIGIAGRDEPVATERTNIYRYTNSFADLNSDGTGNDNIPYGFEALQRGGTDKRIGGLATVQWKPSDRAELRGDFFYSHVQYEENQRGFSVQDLPFGNSFSNVTVVDGAGVDGSATNFADYGIQLQNNNQFYTYKDDLFAGGLHGKLSGDDWALTSDIAYSNTTRHAEFLNIYTEAVNPDGSTNIDGVGVSWMSNPGSPSGFSFNQSLTDPELNQVSNLEIPSNGNGAPIIHDKLFSSNADFSYFTHGSWINTLTAGFRVTSRAKDLTQRTQYGSIDPANRGPLDASLMLPDVTWSGEYAGLPNSMAIDTFAVADQLFGGIDPQESVDDMHSSWEVDEHTYAGYVQADFDHAIGGMSLTGNIGLRVVRTEETSLGTHITQDPTTFVETPHPIAYHNNFTDWLPALNATLHIDDKQQIRLALSRAIARAPLDDLNASFAVYSGSPPSAYGGNPALEPYRANQADLTYEHYFNKDTAATVSLFYKKLDTFIVQQVSALTVDGVTYDDAFHQPVNGHGGNIKGVEVSYQQVFSFLPKPLDGLGVYANYSYTDSNVHVAEFDNAISSIPLPGLSKNVYNLSLFYSKYGVDARVAYRYRSAFATQTGDTDRILINHSEGILSAELSYAFPETSPLKGLKLLAQADNLTDTPYQLYYGETALQGRYETFGRRFWLGASITF